jgi:hypothetical protein
MSNGISAYSFTLDWRAFIKEQFLSMPFAAYTWFVIKEPGSCLSNEAEGLGVLRLKKSRVKIQL